MSLRSRALTVGLIASALLGAQRGAMLVRAQDAESPSVEQQSIVEIHFTPTRFAQIAVWIEDESGHLLKTLGLTDAVAVRGIGNRPGASQMNSGFRWPYGRREGVLPIWAHKRAEAPGAQQFKRVIFQDRLTEGLASRTSSDASPDAYYCLSFDVSKSQKDALDAVSCATTQFNSDKGRYITAEDVDKKYGEPYEDVSTHEGRVEPLSVNSLYPPRRDVGPCNGICDQHADAVTFDAHVRSVMPDIDSVTMATPPGDTPQTLLFAVPKDWSAGSYKACIEINVEGDDNKTWSQSALPTPHTPSGQWDSWAVGYGYPYRGQPSVVYCTPFELGTEDRRIYQSDTAVGSVASWDTAAKQYGKLGSMVGMTDDPVDAPGSGADRLKLSEQGDRMQVVVKPPLTCKDDSAPTAVSDVKLGRSSNELHAHEWVSLSFRAASDDDGIFRYEVRVSTSPMPDEEAFMRGMPAKSASIQADALRVPVDVAPGEKLQVDMGGLVPLTHYYVGVRAVDACAHPSPVRVAEVTTPKRVFATVTPCFVATAAYGTPLASEISALRRLRDRELSSNVVGRAFVDLYMQVGPKLADVIREHEQLRALARTLLSPIVAAARSLDD